VIGLDNPLHLLLLLVVLLLLFGAKRLPEMGRSLGGGLRGFKESINGEHPALPADQLPVTTSLPQHAAHSVPEDLETREQRQAQLH
jgi:sec-independent protein translocase protein TatA